MNKQHFYLGFLATGLTGLACPSLAAPGDQKPVPPFVIQNRDSAAWEVKITHPKSKAGEENPEADSDSRNRLAENIAVQIHNGMRRDIVTWSDGTTTEMWFSKGLELRGASSGHVAVIATNDPDSQFFGGYKDFPELAWVGLKHFSGIEVVGGKACFVYRYQSEPQSHDEIPTEVGGFLADQRTAWIDAETLLPVRLLLGKVDHEFSHKASGSPLPRMPDQFGAAVDRIEGRLRRAKMYEP